MNAKRWIAIGIVAALLVVSGITKIASTLLASDDENEMSLVDSLMATDSGVAEVVMEEGNPDKRIAVLSIDGAIQDTGSSDSLLGGSEGYNHTSFMDQLEQIREDDSVSGVLLNVNSPGGGVVESAEIRDKILQIKKEKKLPVYVSFGSMAASGGYYVSAPADKIFASPETLTGSIGVIMQGYDFSELMKKVGISDNTIKSGKYKDIMSSTRPMTAEEKAIMQSMIDDSYSQFVKVVAEGRHMTDAEVRKIADGRIYDGRQAKANGLIDAFGYEEQALDALKKEQDLKGAQVFEYDSSGGSLASLFSSSVSQIVGQKSEAHQAVQLMNMMEAPRLMYLYGK
ncbi:protease/peptidase [Listeria weihenstephanensis FSL R9-0317]|uniref:Signal peptidase n=1 Tax=Listeria weihenstephanensis TaxID=1006155 RepID=A0A1S7FVB1_9LIST|nr:signal peptide peptidase SppA [Listeria weihenstephanensis]AQY51332.1 signal peptidase [Listeria weihenstephanensis]EUJ36724.1 protease/peptidase [Listeria weihenstephanensis FSL R9-0317]